MELKKVKVDLSDTYNLSNYPSSGMFLNENDNNVYYVSKVSSWVLLLDSLDVFKVAVSIEEGGQYKENKKQGVISESFALKMLAINNGTKVEDLKL